MNAGRSQDRRRAAESVSAVMCPARFSGPPSARADHTAAREAAPRRKVYIPPCGTRRKVYIPPCSPFL